MKIKMIYISTHAHTDTGGPEALLQLALALSTHLKVTMFPSRIQPRFIEEYPNISSMPKAFPPSDLTSADVVVLPEIEKCRKFGNAKVFIWLLSIYAPRRYPPQCTPIGHNSWTGRLWGNVSIIRPYITPSTVKFCKKARRMPSKQRNLTLIDKDSPPRVRALGVWVSGFKRDELMQMLTHARYVVDWKFRGSERMPIEALLCGASVLTSREPSNNAFGEDFHFPSDSFVTRIEDIADRIRQNDPPPNMSHAIAVFELLGPDSMWKEARFALGV